MFNEHIFKRTEKIRPIRVIGRFGRQNQGFFI